MKVTLVFDNGPQVETLTNPTTNLCDGQWHSLEVTKIGQRGTISVDGGDPAAITSQCDNCMLFTATNTNGPLYIGGLSGEKNCQIKEH